MKFKDLKPGMWFDRNNYYHLIYIVSVSEKNVSMMFVCESQRTLEVDKLTYPGVLWDAKDHYFRTAKLISENPKKRFRETISAIFSKEVVFKDTD